MPHFVTLSVTPSRESRKSRKVQSPKRLDAAKKAAEKAGGKVHGFYLTLGKYDGVLISEFPNDEACAQHLLSLAGLGNVTTQTLKAFTEAEYRNIIGGL